MKRNALIVLVILLTLFFVLFARIFLIPIWNIGTPQANNQETFLVSSQSRDGKYKLEAYKTEPGATVDFSIKVYMVEGSQKELIYDAYHEYEVQIAWVNNSTVSINGKILNLSLGEKYDWRTN